MAKSVVLGSHYAKCGRNFWRRIQNGKITISTGRSNDNYYDADGDFIIENGEIVEVRHKLTNGNTRIIRYGDYMKVVTPRGKVLAHLKYRPGTNCAKVREGIYRKELCNLGHYKGTLTQKCYGGSMRKEEFKYKNGRIAYSIYYGKKKGTVVYPNGKIWVEFVGELAFGWKDHIFTCDQGGKDIYPYTPMFERFDNLTSSSGWRNSTLFRSDDWSIKVYDPKGKIKFQGQRENRQNAGRWIINYEPFYFMNGIECPEKMYLAKPEELVSAEIMALKNIQLRTALATKKGYESILKDLNGKEIDKEGDYALYELPITNPETRGDTVLKLLKVRCPSTGAYYTLRVHPQCTKVEQARQWTFGADLLQENEVVEGALELIKET